MADRKENELTKANNFDYVRALDSNGNSIQISKSDLVSVLEELIGLNLYLKRNDNGGIESFAFNNNPGIYTINDSTDKEEAPQGAYGFGLLLILKSGSFYAQLYFPNKGAEGIYTRTKYLNQEPTGWINLK